MCVCVCKTKGQPSPPPRPIETHRGPERQVSKSPARLHQRRSLLCVPHKGREWVILGACGCVVTLGTPPAEDERDAGSGSGAPAGPGAPCRWPEPAPARQCRGWAGGGFCLPVLYTLFSRWGGGRGAEKVFEFQSGWALKAFRFCCGERRGGLHFS